MENIFTKILVFVLSIILIIGCASANYVAPTHVNNLNNYSRIIEKSFDETWQRLIEYSASTFFSIDNFEKESGLITLSFGSSNPSRFVTGGQWEANWGTNHFSGDYVDFLNQHYNGTLNGKMNIVVSKINENKTKVTVNARYIFNVPATNNSNALTWSFDSGNCGTIRVNAISGTSPERTICPTYKAENDILKSLETI